ncbi:ZIP family metal transporter [Caldisalinibacter kiritimatiensis]|uniref:Metal transporter, ZIP family n=1 Tax=Caldisalinibacter kiritimatiensis TaxID=1304284 RepID=R1ATE0_9FIRM|nr:ZIP family metal transporter [Caldisalinibacter kiritimatiensis]EOC99896.1 Metal transporter, ZIP family [Caldisalinibacter kiritimatiensis]
MQGIIASIIVGLCTGIGSLPLLLFKKVPIGVKDGLLGFAGGVMVFASSFNLIRPAMQKGSLLCITGGIIAGTLLLTFIEYVVPHTHTNQFNSSKNDALKKTLLLGIAVAIHNTPEGFAVGVGYGSGDVASGLNLALAMGIQNIPEGLVVAASLKEAGASKKKMVLFSFLTGIGEPIAAAIGLVAVGFIENILPFILALTAGAMFYVVSHELIPESHGGGNEMLATYGFILGLILMIIFKCTIGE